MRVPAPIVRRVRRLERLELTTLLLLASLFLGCWTFAEIADEVMEGDSRAADRALLLALRTADDVSDPLGPGWLEESARDLTALGGIAVLGLLTLAAVGYTWIDGKPHAAVFVTVAVGGGILLSSLLKEVFERPRPDLVPHGAVVYTASFPSGHSMLSAVTYLTLGALLARLHEKRRVKAYLFAVALLLTLVIGFTRVYLGVHWPTDVLAGWTAGAAWAVVCWLAVRVLQRRGQVEPEGDELAVEA